MIESLAHVAVPAGATAELIVADNGSSDETPRVAERSRAGAMRLRYVAEPRRGRSFAFNRVLAGPVGDVIAFTDDDVRFPPGWLSGLCAPILSGEADAVAGGVSLTPSLHRAWMQPFHRTMLASTEEHAASGSTEMVGANMAVSRAVLARVPQFDTELGPGAMGFFDDTLFFRQISAAGFRVAALREVAVEHCPDPGRLRRAEFVRRAVGQGRSLAYVHHHWEHVSLSVPLLRWLKRGLGLLALRLSRPAAFPPEGISAEEFQRIVSVAYAKQFRIEGRRPRSYDFHGLRKADRAAALRPGGLGTGPASPGPS